jgi:hypothetical protein
MAGLVPGHPEFAAAGKMRCPGMTEESGARRNDRAGLRIPAFADVQQLLVAACSFG